MLAGEVEHIGAWQGKHPLEVSAQLGGSDTPRGDAARLVIQLCRNGGWTRREVIGEPARAVSWAKRQYAACLLTHELEHGAQDGGEL